ncbi:RNA polymerase sigma factor [Luteimonas sp. A277]
MTLGPDRKGAARSPLSDRSRAAWFAEQILPHEPGLRRWLWRRCTSVGLEVDDILQESYALLAARQQVNDIINPRAYLYQTAHSLILRDIRRARIVPILAIESLGPIEFADDLPTPEETAEQRDLLSAVDQVIESMPNRTREAYSLRRVHDVPQREIARRMGITEKAVEKLIARGIRWMSEWLAREGG